MAPKSHLVPNVSEQKERVRVSGDSDNVCEEPFREQTPTKRDGQKNKREENNPYQRRSFIDQVAWDLSGVVTGLEY